MGELEILDWLGAELRRLLHPLTDALATEQAFAELLARYGWVVDPTTFSVASVQSALGIASDLEKLTELLTSVTEPSGEPSVEDYTQLVSTSKQLVAAVQAAASSPAPAGLGTAWPEFTADLFEGLVGDYLEAYHARAFALLLLGGVISETSVEVAGASGRVNYVKRALDWDRLGKMISEPGATLKEVYHYNDPQQAFDSELVIALLQRAWSSFQLPVELTAPPASRLDVYYPAGNPLRATVQELHLKLIDSADPETEATFAASIFMLPVPPPTNRTGQPSGALIGPVIAASGGPLPATLLTPLSVDLKGELASDGAVAVELHPGSLQLSVAGGSTINAAAQLRDESPHATMLLGSWLSSRIELVGPEAMLSISGLIASPEVSIELGAAKARGVLDLSSADSFIAKFIGGGEQVVEFPSKLVWSSKTGLSLGGQGSLKLNIPLNLTLSVVEIDTLALGLVVSDGTVGLMAGLSGSLNLGPFVVTIEDIGIKTALEKNETGSAAGFFGDHDFAFGFKPPSGLGAELDAVVIKGGGFLAFDEQQQQYAGVLELAIEDTIQVKAIGLLTTKLPGGQSGFSLLLIITAQFPPIQLGFGFVLTGIGGLAGVNRTMDTEALRSGVRNHTVEAIMFPDDPVANAPQIISDVAVVFPPAEGRYVFGPMLELGWGTPPLITAELGVVLCLPAPVTLAILGEIKLALPEEELALVEIHLSSVGIIEFDKQDLSVDAALHDSQIVGFVLSGEMALRFSWGTTKNFVLSVGGLNPRYQPPPGFPSLQRVALSLGEGENPRITLDGYLAVTANSLQFGALLDIKASAGDFSVHGFMGFDILIITSPFSFIAELAAGVELLHGSSVLMSVQLALTLTGPSPIHAKGKATAHLLFIDVSVPFDHTWGDATHATLPSAEALGPLVQALGEPGNWSASAPPESEQAVTIGSAPAEEGTILVHPFGRITLREKVVPLEIQITKFGSAAPAQWDAFQVGAVTFNGAAQPHAPVQDYFARGQFFDMSDDDKLSKESYELQDSGFSAGSTDMSVGAAASADLGYETRIVDTPPPAGVEPSALPLLPATAGGEYAPSQSVFASAIRFGAGALATPLNSARAKYTVPGSTSAVSVTDVSYVVASTLDLSLRGDVLASATTQVGADLALADHLRAHPEDIGRVQVLPAHEALV